MTSRSADFAPGCDPSPRTALRLGAVLLAAGLARRMGQDGPHKLLAEFGGVPLVRRSAAALLAVNTDPVVVVTGHRRAEIETSLSGLDLRFRHNADFADGMGGSLACGFRAPELASADGILIMLADMPGLEPGHLAELMACFDKEKGAAIVRAAWGKRPGHPVIVPQALRPAIERLRGDVGARTVIADSGFPLIDIDIGPAALLDVDTADAVEANGGVLRD